MKIQRTDGRNLLFPEMKYQVLIKDVTEFYQVKSWCFKTWEFCIDYDNFHEVDLPLNHKIWSYRLKNRRDRYYRIYLKGDDQCNLFTLRWA